MKVVEKVMTAAEAESRYDLSRGYVSRMCRNGEFPDGTCRQSGKTWLIESRVLENKFTRTD